MKKTGKKKKKKEEEAGEKCWGEKNNSNIWTGSAAKIANLVFSMGPSK